MKNFLPETLTLFDRMVLTGGAINMVVVATIVIWYLL
jgi:hypothetical protein